jgi:hypothetical protein
MTVYEVTWKRAGTKVLHLDEWAAARRKLHPVAHLDPDVTIETYRDPVVFLVNDTNERDYYGQLQLVSVHRTWEGAAAELERLKQAEKWPARAHDLELGIDYLRD